MKRLREAFCVVLFIALVTACQAESPIRVRDVWARSAPAAAENAAFYLTVDNRGATDDTLIGAGSPACTVVELHEIYEREPEVMGMRPVVGGIDMPAGATVSLEPGGLHVMCLGKTRPFDLGASLPLTLTFASAGEVSAEAEIRDEAP